MRIDKQDGLKMVWWVQDGWAGNHRAVGDLVRCVHPASLAWRGGTFKVWCVWRLSGWLSALVGRQGMEAGSGHSCVSRFDSHWGSAEIFVVFPGLLPSLSYLCCLVVLSPFCSGHHAHWHWQEYHTAAVAGENSIKSRKIKPSSL